MTKITLLGITHIDKQSQDRVEKFLLDNKPEAICLELDEYRLNILKENELIKKEEQNEQKQQYEENVSYKESELLPQENEEDYFKGSNTNYMDFVNFSAILEDIGFFESRLANIINTDQPGNEMLKAYNIAKEIGSEIYLIDRSIYDINKAMEEEISPEEAQKFQNLMDEILFDRNLIAGTQFKEENTKESIKTIDVEESEESISLNEVFTIFKDQDSLTNILEVFKENFPKLFSILLDDRNDFMVKKILEVAKKHKEIVVILGFGHLSEVAKGLKQVNSELQIEIFSE